MAPLRTVYLIGVTVVSVVFAVFLARKLHIVDVPVFWHDSPLHFFGGYGWGMIGLFVAAHSRLIFPISAVFDARFRSSVCMNGFAYAIGTALFVGVLWEIVIALLMWMWSDPLVGYMNEAAIDIVVDAVGGATAGFTFYLLMKDIITK